jgi:hypothetical protein
MNRSWFVLAVALPIVSWDMPRPRAQAEGVFSAEGSAADGRRAAPRDWGRFPAIVELDTDGDVYALGDVHGDPKRLVEVLLAARLIAEAPEKPDQVRWRAGRAVLVCIGDLIDKGDHSIDVLLLFKALQAGAEASGGRVIVTMGNHEAEFLAKRSHDEKAAEFLDELARKDIDPGDVAAGRDRLGLGLFLRSLPFAARVNDWFFTHAGHTHGRTLADLDAALGQGVDTEGYGADILLAKKSLLEARLHPNPWWEKEGDSSEESLARLAADVKALGVKHLVIGHQREKVEFSDGTTRHKGQMYQKYDGLIFLIDVGMSRAVGNSEGAILRIHGGESPSTTVLAPGKPPARL